MNWQTLSAELDYLLQDIAPSGATVGQAQSYPADLRTNCFNRAQEFFAVTHTAPMKIASLTAYTAFDDGLVAALPADLIQIGGIKRRQRRFVNKRLSTRHSMSPGSTS